MVVHDSSGIRKYNSLLCQRSYVLGWTEAKENTRASDEVIRGLVEALGNITTMAKACNWERYTTGRQILLADVEKALAQAREYLDEDS